jgi:hypothetical protein
LGEGGGGYTVKGCASFRLIKRRVIMMWKDIVHSLINISRRGRATPTTTPTLSYWMESTDCVRGYTHSRPVFLPSSSDSRAPQGYIEKHNEGYTHTHIFRDSSSDWNSERAGNSFGMSGALPLASPLLHCSSATVYGRRRQKVTIEDYVPVGSRQSTTLLMMTWQHTEGIESRFSGWMELLPQLSLKSEL